MHDDPGLTKEPQKPAPAASAAPVSVRDAGKRRVRCPTCFEVVTPNARALHRVRRAARRQPGHLRAPRDLSRQATELARLALAPARHGHRHDRPSLHGHRAPQPRARALLAAARRLAFALGRRAFLHVALLERRSLSGRPLHLAAAERCGPPPRDADGGGPVRLPEDVVDVLPLDADRFALALRTGIEIHGARTGEVMSLVSDAPQAPRPLPRRRAPLRDVATADLCDRRESTSGILKTLDIGASHRAGGLRRGRPARARLGARRACGRGHRDHYHAEMNRIHFGDDAVGPIGIDDTGTRGSPRPDECRCRAC